jgi:adenylyltransferase/sulfurtransferase
MERYARQTVFRPIGEAGQRKLLESRVAVVGMGALGTATADHLCRAGVGHIRMADRDYVELTNLQRQTLYTEEDARQSLPKSIAAFNHLSAVNSEIALEPVVADVNGANILSIIEDADLVLDATDNLETRLLINEACHKRRLPWIYGGALGAQGLTMNILPEEDAPCLKCLNPSPPSGAGYTCGTFGVVSMITGAIASAQSAEALKLLTQSGAVRKKLLVINLWDNYMDLLEVKKNPGCPVCVHGRYEYLNRPAASYATGLCGSGAIQITPPKPVHIDFGLLSERLSKAGNIQVHPFHKQRTNPVSSRRPAPRKTRFSSRLSQGSTRI